MAGARRSMVREQETSVTLEEMEKLLTHEEALAWGAATSVQESAPDEAQASVEVATLLYAAATLLRRAIAVQRHEVVTA